jgi:SAM-dependent methyltransferase
MVANLWRLAVGPLRERGLVETLRSARGCWQARRVEAAEGFDRRFGTDTVKHLGLRDLRAIGGDVQQLWRYWPTPQALFRRLLDESALRFEDLVFVDLGSGKGRVLLLASESPFRRIVGVELSPALHRIAERNVRLYRSPTQRCTRFELLCMDAADYRLPEEEALVYLFQPFPKETLARVIENLRESLRARPRRLAVAYVNPILGAMLTDSGLFTASRSGAPRAPGEFAWTLYEHRP